MLVASLIGRLLFAVWRSRRREAIYWSSRATGLPVDDPRTVTTARRSMVNFARFTMDFVDSVMVSHRDLNRLRMRKLDNKEVLEDAAKDGRGRLLISAHLGNWETLGAWISLLKQKLHVVVLPLPGRSLDRLASEVREHAGFNLIDTDGAATYIIRALRSGEWVAILADRPVGERGELVEFLGERARHPIGAVKLAKRVGVPVIVGGCWSVGTDGYEGRIFDPLETDDPEVPAEEIMVMAMQQLESLVTKNPDQWYIAFTSDPVEDEGV